MGSPVTLISFELSSDSIALIELSVATVNCLKLARVLFNEARDIFGKRKDMHKVLVPLFLFVTGGWLG